MTTGNSSSFKYNLGLLDRANTEDGGDGAGAYRIFKNGQILVPLKYISSFFRSLELPLINTKLHLELSWKKFFILINVANNYDTGFQITKTELYVPVVTLNTDDNKQLRDLLKKGLIDRYIGMNIKVNLKYILQTQII